MLVVDRSPVPCSVVLQAPEIFITNGLESLTLKLRTNEVDELSGVEVFFHDSKG